MAIVVHHSDHVAPSICKSGSRSVGIVPSQTQATEFFLECNLLEPRQLMGWYGMDLSGLGQGSVESSHEHGNEPSDYVWEFLSS
jgi:hypothetical protein